MVMPLLNKSLQEYIDEHRMSEIPIKERKIWKVMAQLLLALKELRNLDIVHCDLKPANILIGDDDKVFLCDFNSALVKQKNSDAHRSTPSYCRWALITPAPS